nr:prtC [Porphyromonas gingivalis]
MTLMRSVIDAAQKAQISAIIASDVAAMTYANEIGVEVHLSTQLNISNAEALRFIALAMWSYWQRAEYGSGTYNPRDHRQGHICGPKGHPVRIEMFAHGALCMAVSGKCYLSLHEHNTSANRGACAQICRRGYTVKDSGLELDIENQYIMSPKDLKTIHFINKMMDAGVRVFKIEGRARGPEYVYTVCRCYKEAIEAYCNGTYDEESIGRWDEQLATVFNRGFWDGYYLGQRLGEWTHRYGSGRTRQKTYVGKGIKYFSRLGVAEFEIESGELHIGDEIVITGPTTGVIIQKVEEIRYELQTVEKATKGQRISIPVKEKVRPSDKLYRFDKREE